MKKIIPIIILFIVNVLSGVAVVYAKHLNRKTFFEIQSLSNARDELVIEWERLKLEQSAWSTHSRIEQVAREKLHMRSIQDPQFIIVNK